MLQLLPRAHPPRPGGQADRGLRPSAVAGSRGCQRGQRRLVVIGRCDAVSGVPVSVGGGVEEAADGIDISAGGELGSLQGLNWKTGG